ncbi:hypothetical protein K7X08_024975 [Anisodus acutangulus]|uniref:Uncharacterized protein n=1 Tax=Anisodus acutangulus TaxID=402998 RepID=A0A9Q1MCN7_9SOLA|nr:hypothetical protein K7X08_024975 [Anisodus acutangulus]
MSAPNLHQVPKVCAAGSHLEDVVFEVINSAGEVDEDVDGEEEDGHSHTLLIRQDSLRGEDNVHVEKAVNSTHEITQPSSLNKEILLLEDSYFLKGPGTAYDNNYDGSILPFKGSCASVDLEDRLQNLDDDICRYGICISQCEANVETLNIKQSNIEIEMSILGGHIGLDSFHDVVYDKDMVVERIEGKVDTAAAVVHRLLRSPISEQLQLKYAHDILRVVALLGEMLAVVCKSRAAARALENYEMDGNVNCASALDIFAAKLGSSINDRYLVICLEDIRPYTQEFRTASGHGLGETLFYRLLGKLQVYKSREHLYMASSCIEDGAVSLDGGMMRGNGVVSAGSNCPCLLRKRIEDKKLELSTGKDQQLCKVQEEVGQKAKYKKQIEESGPSPGMYNSDMDISQRPVHVIT